MNVSGVELEFDFYDADQLEVYERENKVLVDKIQNPDLYEGKSTADSLRFQCKIVNEFFDNVFGYGTAERLFHGKNNIKNHMEAFGIVTDAAMDSSEEFRAMAAKYSPNRAERRAEQKSQRHNTKSFQDFKGNPYVKGKQKNPYHGKSMNPVNQ